MFGWMPVLMELRHPGISVVVERDEMDGDPSSRENHLFQSRYHGMVKQKGFIFDGEGNYFNKEWDLTEGRD
ncbi:hypothetical protein Leryth_004093 [Lithospermum erythrorhizon]|nr:hypothetical protein Leryth_004093 [Lithospermum erythrorhizon]